MSGQDPRAYWRDESQIAQKISLAFLAYAAGDAFGVQFEFAPKILGEIKHELIEKPGWPFGAVSDDTLLSILTVEALAHSSLEDARRNFLVSLRAAIPQLRGLGPTTRSALGLPVREVELSQVGQSNGGMMRTALLGLSFTADEIELRRSWVGQLTAATHPFPKAQDCAQILAAGFSAALESCTIEATLDSIIEEVNNNLELSDRVVVAINNWRAWTPPDAGVSNDSLETLLAVLYVVSRVTSTRQAYSIACKLGGDTDTVAALAGSLYAATICDFEAFFEIDWLTDVDWQGVAGLKAAIQVLIDRRATVV
ncbi:MAG: ADP-ribosylglycohydrolase family protein [Actinomycetes bacterium]